MPTYQYACTSCGHKLEAVQSFSDDALTVCPECQGALRKVYSAVGIVFKGSGFYRTDSRSEKSGAPTSSITPAKSDSGSDPKPGSKSESSGGSTSDSTSSGKSSDSGTGSKAAPSSGSTSSSKTSTAA